MTFLPCDLIVIFWRGPLTTRLFAYMLVVKKKKKKKKTLGLLMSYLPFAKFNMDILLNHLEYFHETTSMQLSEKKIK